MNCNGYSNFFRSIRDQNTLVMDTISLKPAKGIPSCAPNIMQHEYIERIAGVERGAYRKDPERVYDLYQRNIGVNVLDQYIPTNALTMGDKGYENTEHGATTGAHEVICDGMLIDSPEAVAEHLEKIEFPRIRKAIESFNEDERTGSILESEMEIQKKLGSCVVKTGHGFVDFPKMAYMTYGYSNYFMAYGLYNDVIERHFSLQAELALLNNRAAVKAYTEGGLPPLFRLDHDMADSRGTLVDMRNLDRVWFPYFERCIEPLVKANVRLIWHCDGNLMQMVPRLIDVGVKGFQGFQYEDGMDYEKICSMKTRDGEDLIIWAGVSVTRTLPFGKPSDVKREMEWLVEKGPKTGLFLKTSSSVAPGVPWENIKTMIEGFKYYQKNGRAA